MRKFEFVKDKFKKNSCFSALPKRGTKGSAGYDFYSPISAEVAPGNIVKIWTDVKVLLNETEVLLIVPRSSMGGKWALINTIGVIDSDYYGNEKNDGNIGIFLKNISDETLTINQGDRIAQGIFINYLVTDDDDISAERNGGFGSTGE